jgi:hypothetical protein
VTAVALDCKETESFSYDANAASASL